MADAAQLQIVISAQDLASAKLKEVQAQSETMGKSFEKAGSTITNAGHTLLPFSAAAGVGLGLAVHAAENFNQQMLLIQTQAGGSAKEVSNLTNQVLKLAPAVGQSPQELAKALFFIESAGFRGAQAMDILKLSAEGAAVGQADLSETTKVLTSLMADHIQGAENATAAMGNLNAIVGAGKMTFNDLNAAMATGIGATAGAFGVSLQSVGAALATLTNKGVPAVDAASHLRMLMLTMELPTTAAAKALESMGLTTTDAGNRTKAMADIMSKSGITTSQLAEDLKKPNGISVALTDLKDRLMKAGASSSDASAVIEKSLGGIRAGNTAVMLANDLGSLNDRFAQIGKTGGDFNKSWQAQQEQAKQKMESFKASVSVLQVELGNAFLPALDDLIKHISGIVKSFENLSPHTKKLLADFLLFVAILTPMLLLVGNVIKSISLLGDAFVFLSGKMGITSTLASRGAGLTGIKTAASEAESAVGMAGGRAGLVGALGALGPAGILSGIAIAGVAAFTVTHWSGIKKAVEEVGTSIGNVLGTPKAVAGPTNLTPKQSQAAAAAAVPGVNKAVDKQATTLMELATQTDNLSRARGILASTTDALNKAIETEMSDYAKYGPDNKKVQDDVKKVTDLSGKQADAQAKVNDAQKKVADTQKLLNQNTASLVKTQGGLLELINQLPAAHTKVKQATDKHTDAINNVNGKQKELSAAFALFSGVHGPGAVDAHKRITTAAGNLSSAHNDLKNKTKDVNKAHDDQKQALQTASWWAENHSTHIKNLGADAKTTTKLIDDLNRSLDHNFKKGSIGASYNPNIPKFASGVTNFSGGLAMVGEGGPELVNLPAGSSVIPNNRVGQVLNNSRTQTVTIGSINLGDASAVTEFFKQLDRDNILVSKGLTPARGT